MVRREDHGEAFAANTIQKERAGRGTQSGFSVQLNAGRVVILPVGLALMVALVRVEVWRGWTTNTSGRPRPCRR